MTITTTLLTLLALTASNSEPQGISAQGMFLHDHRSAEGSWRLVIAPGTGDFTRIESDLVLTSSTGDRHPLGPVVGTGFLVSELGLVVVTSASHSEQVPVDLTVLDRWGGVRHSSSIPGLTSPRLSRDGDELGLRSRTELRVLDLENFSWTRHPRLGEFALGADGELAGVPLGTRDVVLRSGDGERYRVSLPAAVRALDFDGEGDVWILTTAALYELDGTTGELWPRFMAPEGGELRDLRVGSGALHLGLRRVEGRRTFGRHLVLDLEGRNEVTAGGAAVLAPPATPIGPSSPDSIPWPLAPNTQHPIGNTYAEFQEYSSGNEYLHPGVDVMGLDHQPVFAVADGVVKSILTTSGQYHWRLATGDSGGGTSTGYLYAHLDKPTITVSVGDTITRGQYLGDLVPWPVAGFTHVHFARIEDTGSQWFGDWLCTDNPHLELVGLTETTAPVFQNARGADLFAFCANESSNYRDAGDLKGAVDIIARVGDQLNSSWVCAVQRIRYSIWPASDPGAPVVDDRLAVAFDMHLDTYQDGPFDPFLVGLLYKEDGTCDTDGDYGSRDFYHVITNSDGNTVYETSDAAEAWDTTLVPNGVYVVEVSAWDAAGNSAVASMSVTVSN